MKKVFFLLVVMSLKMHAQDVIVKKDGSTILSKVLEINPTDIKYKKFSNQNGPTYTINISEIMAINYENGEKDSFGGNQETATLKTPIVSQSASMVDGPLGLVKKPADARNAEIISLYNKEYKPTKKVQVSNKPEDSAIAIFGVKSSSIMSNEDVEIKFVKNVVNNNETGIPCLRYSINIKNKSDKVIYIDKGSCFRIENSGESYCYFDISEQTTVNAGGTSGGSIGLGSVAGVLGVGGIAGQIAGGVSVGGGTLRTVSTTYSAQRIIAIPPHSSKNLTEDKQVKTKNGNLLANAEYKWVESSEDFGAKDTGLKEGFINKGQVKIFSEDELPWKREYLFTYSMDADFKTYSTLNVEFYIHEMIGCGFWSSDGIGLEKRVADINEYTIMGGTYFSELSKEEKTEMKRKSSRGSRRSR